MKIKTIVFWSALMLFFCTVMFCTFGQQPESQSYWEKVNGDTSIKNLNFNNPSQADYDRKVTNDACLKF